MRASIIRFGIAALLVIVGIVIGTVFDSVAGTAVGAFVAAVGLIAIVSLAFYEVGLSEDRDRKRHPGG